MKLLLDTHVFLWMQIDPDRIADLRTVLEDDANELLVSAVVAWEIAIKYAVGRLKLPEAPATYVPSRTRALGALPTAITQQHALGVAGLPLIHGDPFDRLLVAQAIQLDATLVTADAILADYPARTSLV